MQGNLETQQWMDRLHEEGAGAGQRGNSMAGLPPSWPQAKADVLATCSEVSGNPEDRPASSELQVWKLVALCVTLLAHKATASVMFPQLMLDCACACRLTAVLEQITPRRVSPSQELPRTE